MVTLIKENRSGKVKERTCADGSNKRIYLKEGERISSPMVSLEYLLFTLIVDEHEGCNMATFGIPGAYMYA